MKLTRRQWLSITGTGAVAVGSWLWLRDAEPRRKDLQAMQTFTEHMKTHCVGRFLIDAPASVVDVSGNYESQIASAEARPGPYKSAQAALQAVDRELEQREADLRRQPAPEGGSRFLGLSQGGAAVRVLYRLDASVQPIGLADGYVARDGGVFFFQTNANDPGDAKELLDDLVDMESALTILAPDELPSTPGFCIGRGLIATNPARGENVNGWSWTLPGHPDVTFGMATRTNGMKIEPGIVDREASILEEAGARLMSSVSTLRKRRFEIAGLPAQEWSVEVTDHRPELQFATEIIGAVNDNAHPRISLSMQVGGSKASGYMTPSLTTGEALALWDAVTRTLRPRPHAF